ncbi:MAG: M16 family metallopeptidase [Steroidobacterales bacterium]
MKLSCTIALGLVAGALVSATASAAPAKVAGYSYVKSLGGIDEYRLDSNGLDVLLISDHSAPVVTFMVTYRVGSRNEVTGTTGATHLLEHLMFKGSTNYNDAKGNSVKQYLESIGGDYNANTWLDRTTYFAETGNEFLEGYMAIEADRMRNLLLREDDRRPEMTVVRNEFEIGENDPVQALDKEIFATAYEAHPYHHSTIGWRSDIEKVPIEKLKAFYDTFYWPDNATVTVVGDFKAESALGLVQKYYGAYSKAPNAIPQVYTEEPVQTGPRRVTVKRAGELGVVGISYKSPAASDPDMPALNVLGSILSSGKTSRFYRALTDKNLTTSVSADSGFFHDPSLFQIYAYLAPGAGHEQVEKILRDEIARITKDGATDQEVATATQKISANIAYARDGTAAVAATLVEDIAAGDWTLYATYPASIRKVTAADVKRVAAKYLVDDRSTTGWFVPVVSQ